MAEQAQLRRPISRRTKPSRPWHGHHLVMAHLLPLSHPRLLVLNVGDSRAYLIRADTIIQPTRDHALLEDSIRDGRLTPARSCITRIDTR